MRKRFRKGFSISREFKDELVSIKVFFKIYKRQEKVDCTLIVSDNDYCGYFTEFKATAKRHPDDVYNLKEGMDTALQKALQKYYGFKRKQTQKMIEETENKISSLAGAVVYKHNKMVEKGKYQFQEGV